MERCSVCNAVTQAKLNLRPRSVLLLLSLLIGLEVWGYFAIAVWMLFFMVMFEIEVSCSTCGNSLYTITIWRTPDSLCRDDMSVSICRLFKVPIVSLVFIFLIPWAVTFLIEVVVAADMYMTSMTLFNKKAIEWSTFEEWFVSPEPQFGPFDGPINTFESNYSHRTFNYTGNRHIAVYIGEEWVSGFRCKCISKNLIDIQIPDFCVCFANTRDEWAQCEFGSEGVPIVVGCEMQDLGYRENVTYVKCSRGWVRPIVSGVYECKDEAAGNFHWILFPFF